MIHTKEKKFGCWRILLIVVGIVLISGFFLYRWIINIDPLTLLNNDFIKNQVAVQIGEDNANLLPLLPDALGFTKPRTYLVLFLNNTEMRPGGGFIGSYATIRMENGKMEILALEGTEKIDSRTPANWKPLPPQPLAIHLGVDRWYFRDANWSPDFGLSSQKALELYAGENGISAQNIDAVIGVTTHVLEELLKITGPMTVDGITFTSENAIETLEYEVEYGYDEKGIHFNERKDIIKPFMLALMDGVKNEIFGKLDVYEPVLRDLVAQKHIMLYSADDSLTDIIDAVDASARVKKTNGDYLMWVDANLAALKTDNAIKRTLSYTMEKRPASHEGEQDYYIGAAKMHYEHTGVFDWRTTRYRTYARVFVPEGSTLVSTIGSMRADRTSDEGTTDVGTDLGKTWFGTFISIEPGQTGDLTFVYKVPRSVEKNIANGTYHLDIQKQPGIFETGLTLNLNFDTNIVSAKPGEVPTEWGDSVYRLETELKEDSVFEINLMSH